MKKSLFLSIIIAVIIELFLFNFNSIKTLFYKEEVIKKDNFILNKVTYNDEENIYKGSYSSSNIEIELNKEVNNIYLDIRDLKEKVIKIELDYTDDANKSYNKFKMGNEKYEKYIVKDIEKTKFISCNHLGKTNKIKISVKDSTDYQFIINNISINKRVPFSINFIRLLLIFSLIYICYRYVSDKDFKDKIRNNENKIFWAIVVLFSGLVTFLYINYSKLNLKIEDFYTTSYKDSLMKGSLELKLDYENVEEMENVYDYSERRGYYPWDVSYYNGKYYMYFSPLPALLMGLYNVSLPNLALIFSIIGVILLALLSKKIIDRYIPKTPSELKLIMIAFILFNSRLLLVIPKIRYYELIVICGFVFTIGGILCHFIFNENGKKRYLFIGSILLSLGVFCRPNMLFVSLISFLLVFKRLNVKKFIIYILPYVFFGSIMMYMNYIRFGNIFEFGVKYQLTVVNNGYSKLNLSTALNGVLAYLFRFPIMIMNFPYVTNNSSIIPYNGFYFNTSNGNGIFIMSVIALVLPFVYKKIDKKQTKFILGMLLVGTILLIYDNAVGGILKRYSLEFAWLFVIPIAMLSINYLKKHIKTVFVLVLISCFMNFLVIFDHSCDDIITKSNTDFYYEIESVIEP